jgi:hypothetical protein
MLGWSISCELAMPALCKSAVQRNELHARFLSKLILLQTQLIWPRPLVQPFLFLKVLTFTCMAWIFVLIYNTIYYLLLVFLSRFISYSRISYTYNPFLLYTMIVLLVCAGIYFSLSQQYIFSSCVTSVLFGLAREFTAAVLLISYIYI